MKTSLAKKFFAVGAAAAMVLAATPFFASAAVHAVGANVLSNGTVYFLNNSGQKQPYTSAGAFLSYGFNSWANVMPASAEDLALPTGSFVPPADGSLINDKGTVYVITGGQRAGFTNPNVFLGLGYQWNNVMAGDTSFMTSMAPVSSTTMAHPVGALVNQNGTIYLITSSGKMGIPNPSVFNSWGYSWGHVVPANSYDSALTMSSGIMNSMTPGLLNPNGTGGVNLPPSSSGLSVTAASTTPASGNTVVAGAAAVDLGEFTFYGNGTVTNAQFKRIGVSSDSTLNNVYLYQGNTRITDAAAVTTGSVINFNATSGLFMVNGPTTISVRADILSTASAGQTIGVQLVSAMSGTAAVSGTPVSGNLGTVAAVNNLGTATVGTASIPASGATVNAGTTNFTIWSAPLTIGTRSMWLKGASFKVIGSLPTNGLQNFKLFMNGTQVASATGVNSLGYVVFDTSASPVNVPTGSNTLEVHADVVTGSSRNFQVSLQNAADLVVTDSNYGVNVFPTQPSVTTFTSVIAGQTTINPGSVTVSQDPTFSATTVTGGATQQAVASYQLKSYGEDVQVNSLTVNPVVTGGANVSGDHTSLNNVSLWWNGAQVGSSQNYTGTALTFSLGSSLIIPANTPGTLQVKADMINSSNSNYTAGTVLTSLSGAANNAQGRSSSTLITVPGTATNGQSLTVGTGNPTVAANGGLLSQSIIANTPKTKIGSFVIQAGSSEGLRVSQITIGAVFTAPTYTSGTVTSGSQAITVNSSTGFSVGNVITIPGATPAIGTVTAVTDATHIQVNITTGGVTPTAGGAITGSGTTSGPATITNMANLYPVVTVTGASTQPAALTPVNPTATNNFSTNFTIPANGTATVDVYADTSSANLGSIQPTLALTGNGAVSNAAVTVTAVNGQVMTFTSGGVNTPTLGGSAALSQLVASAGAPTQGPANAAAFNFTTTTGTATLTEMKVAISDVSGNVQTGSNLVTQMTIGSGANAVTVPVVAGVAYATGLNITVPVGNAGIDVPVTPTYNAVGTNGVATNQKVYLALEYYKSQSGSTVSTVTLAPGSTTIESNPMVLVASYPQVSYATPALAGVSSGAAMGAGMIVAQFTITAPSTGPIRVKQIGFTPTWSGTLTNAATDVVTIYNSSNPSVILNTGQANIALVSGTQDPIIFDNPEIIPAGQSKTYTITADTTGLTTTGNSFRLDLTNSADTYVASPGAAVDDQWAWNDYTTASYMNGYLVKIQPLTGPTFTK